jgi:hypothetical protein
MSKHPRTGQDPVRITRGRFSSAGIWVEGLRRRGELREWVSARSWTCGDGPKASGIRRRLVSALTHPEGRPRRAVLPMRPAGRQSQLPPSDHRLPPRRPGGTARRRTRRHPRAVLRRKARGRCGLQRRFSYTGVRHGWARRCTRPTPTITDAQPQAGRFQAARSTRPAREHNMPTPSPGNGDGHRPNPDLLLIMPGGFV